MAQNSKQPISKMKKLFLQTLILSLSASALIAIGVFLIGEFGDTPARLLISTLAIGLYSLTALCASTLYDRNKYVIFAMLGIIISALGLVLSLAATWELIPEGDDAWKPLLITLILSVGIAHASLLMLIESRNNLVNLVLSGTLLAIVAVASMLIFLVLYEFNDINEIFFRLLGVFAVLDVLGTIVTPILKKTNN